MILLQQWLILWISTLKDNLLRLRFPGLPFFVSILSSCFDLLLLPTSFLALLAFLIITFFIIILSLQLYEDQKLAASSFVSIDKYQRRLKIRTIKFSKSVSPFEYFSSDKLQTKQSTLKITSTIKCMVISFTLWYF